MEVSGHCLCFFEPSSFVLLLLLLDQTQFVFINLVSSSCRSAVWFRSFNGYHQKFPASSSLKVFSADLNIVSVLQGEIGT